MEFNIFNGDSLPSTVINYLFSNIAEFDDVGLKAINVILTSKTNSLNEK